MACLTCFLMFMEENFTYRAFYERILILIRTISKRAMKKVLISAHFGLSTCVSLNKNLSNCGVFLSLAFQKGIEGFWKPVATYVPRKPSEMRILNPYFIQEAAFQFIGLPLNKGLMGKGVSSQQSLFVVWECIIMKIIKHLLSKSDTWVTGVLLKKP